MSTSQAIAKTYTPKAVPEWTKEKYSYRKELADAAGIDTEKWGAVYSVKGIGFAGGTQELDKIGVNTETNTIAVFTAFNKADKPELGKKLYLSDILMGVFTQAGKNPQDLKMVHVDQVINTESRDVFESIYEGLGKNSVKPVEATFRASATGLEKDNFNRIANTPFGLTVDRMNQEFSTGKTIDSYILRGNMEETDEFDMDIMLS